METALAWIGQLYAIEKDLRKRCEAEWKEVSLEEQATRVAMERQGRSRPLLNDFHAWLDADNNAAENALRGIAIGRKNWLFCGSDRGSRAAAIHFSLLASCRRHGHDPFVYFRDVLTRLPALLPSADTADLLPLLPHRWRPA
jgi:hypothetical protein